MQLKVKDVEEALRLPLAGFHVLAPITVIGAKATQVVFTGVSTDTRSIKPGELFIALRSDKADGHSYVAKAIEAGAAGVVVAREIRERSVPVFTVSDTMFAYGQIARWWRDQFSIPVVGVTGSVGKTTVKEMIAAALSPLGPVLKTHANQNTETGVPKALLGIDSNHKAAVVEMGMRGAGQIAYLCGVARPTAGVITLIAENHMELLGSLDAIADAKGELAQAIPETGFVALNATDEYFLRLANKTSAKVIPFGIEAEVKRSVSATNLRLVDGRWHFNIGDLELNIPSPARHDVGNATAAFGIATALGVDPIAAAAALESYARPPMRMEIKNAQAWGGTVINDAYNAAPASMRSAIETLQAVGGTRKIAILGDMKELGDLATYAHRDLGRIIEGLGGLDVLYTVGELAARIPGAEDRFIDVDEALPFVEKHMELRPGDVVLVKASHSMQLERIAEALLTRGPEWVPREDPEEEEAGDG